MKMSYLLDGRAEDTPDGFHEEMLQHLLSSGFFRV